MRSVVIDDNEDEGGKTLLIFWGLKFRLEGPITVLQVRKNQE